MVEFSCEAIWTWAFVCWKIFDYSFNFRACDGSVVLVLPNIKMNPPQVYICSPQWSLKVEQGGIKLRVGERWFQKKGTERDVPVRRIQLIITGFEDGGRDSQVKNYLEPGKSKDIEFPLEPSEGSTDSLVIHWF